MREKLKEIEESLLSNEASFGILCVMGHYDVDTDSDVDEYLLCTCVVSKNEFGVAVGVGMDISKDKELKVSTSDLISVFDLFRNCKRELICDLYEDVNTFSIDKYINRLKYLM